MSLGAGLILAQFFLVRAGAILLLSRISLSSRPRPAKWWKEGCDHLGVPTTLRGGQLGVLTGRDGVLRRLVDGGH